MPSASEEIFPLAASLSGGLIIGLVLSAIVSCVLMTKKTKQYSKRKRILSNNSNALLLSRKYSEHSTEMEIYHSIEEPEMEEKAKTTNRYQQQSSLGTGNGCFDPNTAEREKSPENWVQSERPYDVSNIVVLPSENGANKTTENNDYFTLEKTEC
ncbi:uncharacterized protein LOC134228366 [Saccostrea cucullata]|uniref:uncharacterized protein LOC134228366 n=1 Tax=Saccostrea cuccullata TaxID=36930 RepID=UPI002ED605AF